MDVDIYRSTKRSGKHLTVPAGTDIGTMQFPSDLDRDLLEVYPVKKALPIEVGDKRIAIDSADVIKQIADRGFATHNTTVRVTTTP